MVKSQLRNMKWFRGQQRRTLRRSKLRDYIAQKWTSCLHATSPRSFDHVLRVKVVARSCTTKSEMTILLSSFKKHPWPNGLRRAASPIKSNWISFLSLEDAFFIYGWTLVLVVFIDLEGIQFTQGRLKIWLPLSLEDLIHPDRA